MALSLCNSKSPTHFQIQHSQPILFLNFLRLITIFFLFLFFPFANSTSFNFPNFNSNNQDQWIIYQGDAYEDGGVIQLTKNQADGSLSFSIGRATYAQPIHLWDSGSGNLTDFNTQFSFNIRALNLSTAGDGLAFFLSPFNATIPSDSFGGYLGLFENSTALNNTDNQIVAVEFDTVKNPWDPSSNHVGIDINSIASVANVTLNTSMKDGTTANVWVNYNSTTTTLSVYLTYAENPVFPGNYSLSYVVNLTKVLPEWVSVGFSAATGAWIEIHTIVSWTFNSTLGGSNNSTPGGFNNSTLAPPPPPSTGTGHKMNLRLVVGLAVSIGTLTFGVGLFWFLKWKKINSRGNNDMGVDASTDDDDFEEGTGPRRFTFRELSHATNNFFEGGKLGQGGFGGVYKGVLSDTQKEIAVKRISEGSMQGKKEYKSEVKTISRLRHRNLVQLIDIYYQKDAFEASGVIQLTKNQADSSLSFSVGRATYAQAMHLWDSETGNLTDFNTQFSFNINALNLGTSGDGLAFFLSPFDATIPDNSSGGSLGLFDNSLALNHTNNQIVAVEFDTYQNPWDPSSNHVGIDVNSIVSVANVTLNTSMNNGTTANAWVNYNSTTTTLSVYLTYAENPVFQGNYTLSYVVNLTKVLPEWVSVGFSAATGALIEIHNIVSWSFNSTLGGSNNSTSGPSPPPSPSNNSSYSTLAPPLPSTGMGHKMNPRLVVGLAVIIGTLSCGVGLFWFMKWQKINSRGNNEMGVDASTDDDDDFEKGTGPRRFTFHELSHATNNFFEGGKLGQGGFGDVYKGVLSGTQEEIAVKRISKGSKQGKKEYKSEVKTISRLRHRNLVQLIANDLEPCPQSNSERETRNHLLLLCRVSCGIWSAVMNWWGVEWVSLFQPNGLTAGVEW
ncbi:hypothetical protein RHGRI_022457 [Rhododendron griersonianum]|uniref:Protein kinase domain-containing protein n=1 Tax=Rhododendron griersonianum TaxID=479676 RepID=A0AAV6J3G2_9ERIC|nr:hypothetical protein RHGRI_022457 [Rhododendron griersonianum]